MTGMPASTQPPKPPGQPCNIMLLPLGHSSSMARSKMKECSRLTNTPLMSSTPDTVCPKGKPLKVISEENA